jgi:riboflavin synthase
MFTGIVESTGTIEQITGEGTNKTFWIQSDISDELKVDESVSHNGVCLTVEEISAGKHRVTAIKETLDKSALGSLQPAMKVNLERSLRIHERLDGHIVQGHIDTTGKCTSRKDLEGSVEFSFSFPEAFAPLLIEKGSISVNGVSLTAFKVSSNSFSVAIIPYTLTHTGFQDLRTGDPVNLEFDILGKYVQRILSLSAPGQ